MVAVLVFLTFAIAIWIQVAFSYRARKRIERQIPAAAGYTMPEHLFFHNGHTWAQFDTSGEAKVGIDHFLLGVLGSPESVNLPDPGRLVMQGERIFSVSRGGREIELVSPIEGVVASVNKAADLEAEADRKNPYGSGWLFTIRPRNLTASLRNMRIAEEAIVWFDSEVRRFSEFLMDCSPRPAGVGVTMQDGGQHSAGIIDGLDDEQLRAFEKAFLDEAVHS
jgi:glycine cleavage system H protein